MNFFFFNLQNKHKTHQKANMNLVEVQYAHTQFALSSLYLTSESKAAFMTSPWLKSLNLLLIWLT